MFVVNSLLQILARAIASPLFVAARIHSHSSACQSQEAEAGQSPVTGLEEASTRGVRDLDPVRVEQRKAELQAARKPVTPNTGTSTCQVHFLVIPSFCFNRKRSRSSSSSDSDSDAGSRRRLTRTSKLSEVERLAEIERQRAAHNARIMYAELPYNRPSVST